MAISETAWEPVCDRTELLPERGAAVLVDGRQIALFLLADGSLRAVDNFDPCSQAYVLSRGIVGTRRDTPVVASPMYKQAFDLDSGQCLDDKEVSITCYPVRVAGDVVELGISCH